jgi:hypothetical protein
MEISRSNLHRIVSLTFAILALGLMLLGILWPPAVAELLRSRLAVSLLAAWSAAVSFLFNHEICAGLAEGIREFRKASSEISDEISRSIGGNDDDPPASV